jgi:hypothetical protein
MIFFFKYKIIFLIYINYMYNIESSLENGIILINETFEDQPLFSDISDIYIINITNLENLKKITKFSYETTGMSDGRYLITQYRISPDGTNWSEWLELNQDVMNYPDLDYTETFLEIKWERTGFSSNGSIFLVKYELEGILKRNEAVVSDDSFAIIKPNEEKIIRSPYILKVFSISDFEIITYPESTNLDLMFRYSQDNTRTWSRWEILNNENITTININPIRFFQIEYKITNNTNSNVKIYDINIIGDFQNVSKDYLKSNLNGIRECCTSNILGGSLDSNGNFVANTNFNSSGLPANCDPNVFKPMSDQDKANLYNPYAQTTATNLWNKLSNDATQVFGHQVTYFVTDPDKKGQDSILNEYQLYNVVCNEDIKVTVTDNKFPDSTIKMNMFDLDLFETMEVQVTKQVFKDAFGKQRRPSKEDFLYFCNLNRMYQVDHAQQERGFNNTAVFYKLILKKYNQKSNVIAGSADIKEKMDQLTKNSTIDELFGIEIEKNKLSTANKDQLKPLTNETIRLEYLAEIDKELIENSTTIISKSNYDLSTVPYREPAILYRNFNSLLKKSDNLSYMAWFNLNNYIYNEVYNLIYNYDEQNELGWYIDLKNDNIEFKINQDIYNFSLDNLGQNEALYEEVWYCYLVNIDQRNKQMESYIYKRNVDDEEDASKLPNNLLKKVYYNKQNIDSFEYDIENKLQILASDMRITNIRIFSDVIPENVHHKVLNQYIIGDDSKYLIMADNATEKLYLPRYPLFE